MILFENESKNAAFWFAAEEYIMQVLRPSEPALMIWSTEDTIMIGANQIAEAECDMAYAEAEGIAIVRRPSGGGAIFTDRGTLQVSIILPQEPKGDHATVSRKWLIEPVISTLAAYGVEASHEGRNDIVIDGRKVSGIAQHIKSGYISSHCSLLFNTDLEKLASSLTADREKYITKAIASVRARVANISEFIEEKSPENFRDALINTYQRLQFRRIEIESDEIASIMYERYLNPEWTFGREPAFTFTNKKRFPGGLLEVFLDVKSGVIQSAKINGDFLSLLPVSELEKKLTGLYYRADAIEEALISVDITAYLGSIGKEELFQVLF